MTSKQRFLEALNRRKPDRLPVTTHHVMPYFLNTHLDGISNDAFFDRFHLDPIRWVAEHRPDPDSKDYVDPDHKPGYLEPRRIASDTWRITAEPVPDPQYDTVRYVFHTPRKNLSMVLQSNEYTSWVTERLVKERADIDIIAEFATLPVYDVPGVNRIADEYGERGLIRGTILCFDVYGQPGCWQDASVLFGIEDLIMATYDDPEWVHAFLQILMKRKLHFVDSLKGARIDILELGGGDASSTVISPKIFDAFVAPYDKPVIDHAHQVQQRIVYHTCGGMMPFLERLAEMGPDAMETFTPPGMGGDTDLREAKRRIGDKVCMIGGFDQKEYFARGTPAQTRAAVRSCFEAAGNDGGYILCPSDHFFDAEPSLLEAFADEAAKCVY
ncbi:MAG: methylcobalamin:coenzyme methyltransferase [Bacteroidetes bacterium]|nr:methylcobalamin:coenzyme methyltransferase [Bacteroidota bacterium]